MMCFMLDKELKSIRYILVGELSMFRDEFSYPASLVERGRSNSLVK